MNFFTFRMPKLIVYVAFSLLSIASYSQTKTWIGAGAGGAGTDFNTGSNWLPTGVPTAINDVVITITSDATINLSANASIRNLTYTVNGNGDVAQLYVGANTLTVNGTSEVRITGGNNSTAIFIGVNGGTSSGIIDFVGDATFATALSNTGAGTGLVGNVNSKLIFRGNLTLNQEAFVAISTFSPGTFEFDGTGTQTITWNNSGFYCEMNNVVIGNSNSPTVNHAGSVISDNILGNLTLNGSSVLNLGTRFWNGGTSGGGTGNAGTLTLNSTSKLQLGAATGGQTGSNFPIRFATLSIASGSTVEYTGTVAQTIYDIASPGYGNLTLTNNSTKSPTSGLDVRGDILINTTSTLSAGTGLTHNVGGNLTNNNVFTAGTSTLNFNGSSLQSIGGTSTTTFYNLAANNTAGIATTGITLQSPAVVTNTLTLTNGHITTTATNILTMNEGSSVLGSNYGASPRVSGGSDNSFINGPMRKVGSTAFLFPVGKIGSGHHFCGISAPGVATNAFEAEYMRVPATSLGAVTAVGLSHVSNCEYWRLDEVGTGTPTVDVTLSWNSFSGCNFAVYINDIATLRVAHSSGSNWNSFGGSTDPLSGNITGSITWNGVNTFSPFALASTSALTNPLPVKLVNVKAYSAGDRNKIEWTNLTETDVLTYEVERSSNGTQFSSMSSLAPKSNTNGSEDYFTYDLQRSPVTYYRIKVTGNDRKIIYSPIVKVATENHLQQDITLYPNPVTGRQFTLQMNNAAGNYVLRIYAANGQVIKTETLKHLGGSYSKTIELPGQLQAGQYYLQISGGEKITTSKFIIQ